jgi:hypothetical protein
MYLTDLLTSNAGGDIGEAFYSSDAVNALYNNILTDGGGASIFTALARSLTAEIRVRPGNHMFLVNPDANEVATHQITYIHAHYL